jgi:hypothetical protein
MIDPKRVVDGLDYHLSNGRLSLIQCFAEQEEGLSHLSLRSMLFFGGRVVSKYRWDLVHLGEQSFASARLRRICIPSSVQSIGKNCFCKCRSLREVIFEFGSKLRRIEKSAFADTHLKMIRIPSNVQFIGKWCFAQCKCLREIIFEFGSKLQRIEEEAFEEAGLKILRIPSSVEYIGDRCFYRCKSLCEMTFESESSLKGIGECAFDRTNLNGIEIQKKCEIMSGMSLIGFEEVEICSENPFFVKEGSLVKTSDKKICIRCVGQRDHVVIGKEIEVISRGCFCECESLCEIIFESGSKLRRIEKCGFSDSGIKMIAIPSSVEFIGKYCFSGCKSLYKITFESGHNLQIHGSAFEQTNLKDICIPLNVEFIE